MKRIMLAGLAGMVLLGCVSEGKTSMGTYDKQIDMPAECEKVLGSGVATARIELGEYHIDWISCQDEQGNVTTYKMPFNETKWYKTEIKR